MEDLWNFNDELDYRTNYIIDILKEQCNIFNSKFSKVNAKVVETEYIPPAINSFLLAMAQATSLIGQTKFKYTDELESKQDINEVIKNTSYTFYLFNEKYRFNAFHISITPYFPVNIKVDNDIALELGLEEQDTKIHSIDDFKSIVKRIFNSNKMKLVIHKLNV